ncbi:MAG: hypothetical protein AB7F31_06975 [Parachlamydiales bacterium]
MNALQSSWEMTKTVLNLPVRALDWTLATRPVRGAYWAIKAYVIYELWESAVAQTLVVDTCRHGARDLHTAYLIWCTGLLPEKCSCQCEEGVPFVYLWRDSRLATDDVVVRFGGPLCYANGNPLGVLRFHFRPNEKSYNEYWDASKKDHDQDYPGFYYNDRISGTTLRCPENVPPSHIGMIGALRAGVNKGWAKRISYNPQRFRQGLLQGALALYFTGGLFGLSPSVPEWISNSRLAVWGDKIAEFRMISWPTGLAGKLYSYRIVRWPIQLAVAYAIWQTAR